MDDNTRHTFISGIELFHNLGHEELGWIAERLIERVVSPEEMLFEENTPRRSLFLIREGQVELFKTGLDGEENRLAIFGPGDFLGEGSLMDDYPHNTSARALEKTSLLTIPREDFQRLFIDHPETAGRILSSIARVISRRMRQTSTQVVNAAVQYISGRTRTEHDLLGERQVPYEAYYGVQTLRAMENFAISGIPLFHHPCLINALARVKQAAAMANHDLGLLDGKIKNAIVRSCEEIIGGRFHIHFTVDLIQGGAGTSSNMNANEVIANRSLEILGYEKGDYEHCHPNSHVNLSQSTNDAYPTAMKIALIASSRKLVDVLRELIDAFRRKGEEFAHIIKMGRTQLQDAVPMTLGQEFDAWAATLSEEIDRLEQNAALFLEINMGGTAIGTGINADPKYPPTVLRHLRAVTGLDLKLAPNLVEATQDTGAFVMFSSALKRMAVKLSKISNDLRLLSSGPRAGFGEINLPKMQPGSSIMPGKVNPVIPEVVNQVAFKVIGNDLTVTMGAEAGQLELNVMEPVIVQSLFESIDMLSNAMVTLRSRCIEGITANEKRCRELALNSIGLVTALNPALGYETCTKLAMEALETDRSLYDLVLEKELMTEEELNDLLKPENMIRPHKLTKKNDH
ncbi:MAG: aspartate ammonia-lyase [bacterium]